MRVFNVWSYSHVFAHSPKMQIRNRSNSITWGGFAGKLMRNMFLRRHPRRVFPRRANQAFIHFERRQASPCAISIGFV